MSADLVDAGRRLAGLLLEAIPERLRHVTGVAARAEALAPSVPNSTADTLVAAAWLHDVGYASPLRDTKFHPLDGAVYLRKHGWPDLVCCLVAHQSGSRFIARIRGLDERLGQFAFVEDPISDALTAADNTTSPDGPAVMVDERLREKAIRHGSASPSARANPERDEYIRAASRPVARRLATQGRPDTWLEAPDEA